MLFWLLRIIPAAVIIALLIRHSNLSWQILQGFDWRFLTAAAMVLLTQNVLVALRWWWILRAMHIKIAFFTVLSLSMQGLFFMLFLPGGTVGADVCKAALMAVASAEDAKIDAVFTVLVDRLCGFAGLLVLSFFSAFFFFFRQHYPFAGNLGHLLQGVLIAAPAILVCMWGAINVDFLLKIGVLKKIYDWLDRRSNGFFTRCRNCLITTRAAGKTLLQAVSFSTLVTFPLIILSVYLIGCSFAGGGNAVFYGALASGSIGELAGAIPLTPGGIGVRDALFVQCFQMCGLGKEAATLISLTFTALMFITGSLGAFFALHMLWRKR